MAGRDPLLAGTRVVELGEGIAAPYGARLLAIYGADVIKAEPPAGDLARRAGPFPGDVPHPETSGLFLALNTSKRGVTLDYTTPSGADLLRRLLADTDVLVESTPPGALAAHGLAAGDLQALYPGLVVVSVTPFGQDGPYRDYRVTDIVAHAMGGWMYGGGAPEREPLKPGGHLAAYTTGIVAAAAAMTALWARNAGRERRGQHADVSSMEALLSALPLVTVLFSYSGENWSRTGHPYPFTILRCKDGYMGVNILTQRQWEALVRFIDRGDLLIDPRFRSGVDRNQPGRDREITEEIAPWFLRHTQAEIFEAGQQQRVPFGIVPSPGEVLASPQYAAREFFTTVDHPVAGPTVLPGAPFRLSDAAPAAYRPAPLLGEHNTEVYGALGLRGEDLVALRRAGAI